MTVLKMLALIAAVLFLGFAFFKLGRFIITEWRKIEAEEEGLRRQSCPRSWRGRDLKPSDRLF